MIASIDFIIWTIKHYKFISLKFLEGKCQSYYQIRKLMWHKNIDFFFIVLENEKKKKISCVCNPRVDLCSFFRIANTWEFFSFSSIIKKKFWETKKIIYIFNSSKHINFIGSHILFLLFHLSRGHWWVDFSRLIKCKDFISFWVKW